MRGAIGPVDDAFFHGHAFATFDDSAVIGLYAGAGGGVVDRLVRLAEQSGRFDAQ